MADSKSDIELGSKIESKYSKGLVNSEEGISIALSDSMSSINESLKTSISEFKCRRARTIVLICCVGIALLFFLTKLLCFQQNSLRPSQRSRST